MKKIARGFLLVLEGIDGSGKTTLAERLRVAFQARGREVLTTKEPGGTQLGMEIRHLAQHSAMAVVPEAEFLLFAADRAQHIKTFVHPALQKGAIVISDRMADSSMAYQGYGRGLDRDMIAAVNKWVMGAVEPDLIVYVKVDWKIAWERIHKRGEVLTKFEQEKKDFFEQVAHGFDEIFKHKQNAIMLDGAQDQDTLFEQTMRIVESKL